jgi:hypothetical protein
MATNSDLPIVIDPHFPIPPNLIDVVPQGDARDTQFYSDSNVESPAVDAVVPVDDTNQSQSVAPTAPVSFTIVSQTVRMGSDGTQFVDVVIDIPDQPGISSYDMRVSKT